MCFLQFKLKAKNYLLKTNKDSSLKFSQEITLENTHDKKRILSLSEKMYKTL